MREHARLTITDGPEPSEHGRDIKEDQGHTHPHRRPRKQPGAAIGSAVVHSVSQRTDASASSIENLATRSIRLARVAAAIHLAQTATATPAPKTAKRKESRP